MTSVPTCGSGEGLWDAGGTGFEDIVGEGDLVGCPFIHGPVDSSLRASDLREDTREIS